ncbi:MAG: high-potential iron-sulfur protein [Sulfuricella sp.]|nr:high-potential iron-sulfur protein [Sulfuricella sp.]
MKDDFKPARRQFLMTGGAAIAMIPVVAFTGNALAATNPGMRASMKYQDTPSGDKDCTNCLQFVPGKTPKDLGGCKIFLGDTEVAPKGYCTAWVAIPKK